MKFATPYSHDKKRSALFSTINNEDSLTQQSDAAQTDINYIVKQFMPTGQLPQLTLQPMYGDFSQAGDYRNALDMVRAADQAWLQVPASIRKEFNQDPQAFIAFATDPNNLEKMREWKLAPPAATAATAPAPASAPGAGTPPASTSSAKAGAAATATGGQ